MISLETAQALPPPAAPLYERLAFFIPLPTSTLDTVVLILILFITIGWHTRQWTWDKPNPYNHLWYERPQQQDAGARAREQKSRNIADALAAAGKSVVIFWGSQSGTAERFANRLGRDLRLRLRLESIVADLSDYDAESIAGLSEEHIAIFLLATYGEGDPPDNTAGLWGWLKKPGAPLSSMRYILFGLGNSNYVHYNRVVDFVDSALACAGAERLVDVGKADDAQGQTEEQFLSWKEDIVGVLKQRLGLEEVEREEEPRFSVLEDTSLDLQDLNLGEPTQQAHGHGRTLLYSPTKPLPLKAAKELFKDAKGRSCLHLELDLSKHPEVAYKTGDHLGIWPVNPDQEVDRLVDALGLEDRRHTPLLIKSDDPSVKVGVPSPTTVDALFRYYLEICGPVSCDTVRSLVPLAPTPAAKEFFQRLANDARKYAEFAARNHLTLGKLLELGSTADVSASSWAPRLTMAHILDLLPRTQPRYYSISSSSVTDPRSAHLTVLVAPTALPESADTIPGLTTSYLHSLSQSRFQLVDSLQQRAGQPSFQLSGPSDSLGDGKVFAFTRQSKFKLPTQSACPLIMVAAGTGIAPFRAFLQQRCRLNEIGREVGEMLLFFGCQHPDRDFIYSNALDAMQRKLGGKLRIVTAFSRMSAGSKVYVQHKIAENGDEITRMLESGAYLYICGRSSMAREVGIAVRSTWHDHGDKDRPDAEEWVNSLKRTHRWQEDVWG